MKVLLTGHLGYIGTVMAPMLRAAGHDVTGYDSDLYRRCTYDFGGAIADVRAIIKDIRDATESDLAGQDAVIHLAGLSNDPLGDLNSQLTYDINHRASVRLAQLAKGAGVKRFLFASSCSNYGLAGEEMIDESGDLNPVTAYGRSKVWAERDIEPLGDSELLPGFYAPSDSLWIVAAHAVRHRAQQPHRLGGGQRSDLSEVRWNAVAPDRPY